MAERAPLAADRLAIQEEALRFGRVGLCRCRRDGTVIEMNPAAFEILDLAPHLAGPSAGLCLSALSASPGARLRTAIPALFGPN